MLSAQDLDYENLSYRELTIAFYKKSEDTLFSKKIATKFLKKAKNENNKKRIADGYFLFSRIKTDSIAIIYLDSILQFTIEKPNKDQPCVAYFSKSTILYKRRNFQEALNLALKAQKSAELADNNYIKNLSARTIGLIKSRIGNEKEALKIFRNCYQQMVKNDYLNKDPYSFVHTLYSLSDSYQRNGILDSATILNKEGFELSRHYSKFEMTNYFRFSQGIVHLDNSEFRLAIDSIYKALPHLIREKDLPNIALAYSYIGKAQWFMNEKELAISNLKKTDSIFDIIQDLHPDGREGYLYILEYYRERNNLEQELNYIKKLLSLDSILQSNYKYLAKKVVKDYDTRILISQKENIIGKIRAKKDLFKNIMIALSVLTLFSLTGAFLNYKLQSRYKEKFKIILQQVNTSQNTLLIKENENKQISIPEIILKDLKIKIEKFINEKEFLSPSISLTSMATELQTNSNYLSKFINHFYGKNFNTFINDLRINHISKRLFEDKILQKFTIKAIAAEAGFKNTVSFSKAFYRNHKMQPSFFLKELNKIKKYS